MAVFQHQGKSLNYALDNNAFSEDILFIHGNLASARWWKPTTGLIVSSNDSSMHGRLVAADWVGCGKSSGPRSLSDLSMTSLAEDHLALIQALGLTNVHLVGHSTGGLIALYMMLAEPSLFGKAILLDSVSAQGIRFGPEMLTAFDQMKADRAFCETVMVSTIHGADPKDLFVQSLVDDAFGVHPMIWHGILNALKNIDIRKDIASIQTPTLVLHGELDKVLPEDGSKEISRLLPSANYQQIKGHGHSTNVEDPHLFTERLYEFFS